MEAIATKHQDISIVEASAPSAWWSSAVFGITTAAVYSLALVKAVVLTDSFGTGPQMDAFTIALVLPTVLAAVAAANCGPAMVPVLASAALEGHHARSNAFRSALWLSLGVSLLAVAGLYLLADPVIRVIAPHFDAVRHQVAVELLRVLSLMPAASIVFGYSSAELLSRKKYFVVAVVPAISTAVTIAAILSVRTINMLAYSVVAGTMLQAAVVLVLSLRASRMTSRLRLWTPHTRLILISQLPLMGATIFSVANTSIDQTLAARLPAGNVSALNYANALNSLLIQSVVMATAWVALSDFSDIASSGDLDKLRQRARQYMIALTAVAAPLSIGVLLFAEPSIRLVFQRGAFTSHSTVLVSGAWAGYAWGLVPVAIGMVCVRLLNALHANGSLVIVGITMLPLNAVLDLILMRFYGVFGIGLSTSVVWTFSAAILLYQVARRTGVLLDTPTIRLLLKTLLATALAGLACLGTRLLLGSNIKALVESALVTIATIVGLYKALGLPGAILGKALSVPSRQPDSMPDLPT